MPPPTPDRGADRAFPRVPAHAWAWLQRSRPVLAEAADRLTGGPPTAGFVRDLSERFPTDAFTRDVLVGVIADVAFGGRPPQRRPAGASWDRGLTWWAAAIAGATAEEFESRSAPPVAQRALFGADEAPPAPPAPSPFPLPRVPSADRVMLVAGLRDLLDASDGDCVPVTAVRQLLATLEQGPPGAGARRRQ